ncbi:hypothetical protein vseg_004047 [Gypsophila vaccaria]
MGDTNISQPSMAGLNPQVAAISAKIMLTAMIVLFFIVAFCVFVCLYARWYWSRAEHPYVVTWRHQRVPLVVGDQRRGLDRDTLRELPVVVYDVKNFKEGLECSVCLSEISQGESVRVLPKCSHGFHLECIDMWFMSHSTCPLCRNYVINSPKTTVPIESNQESQENGATHVMSGSELDSDSGLSSNVGLNLEVESRETTTNVMESLGEASGSSSRQKDELVIEIPPSIAQFISEEEVKIPVVSRLSSLKRMLSRGKRVAPSSSIDVEPV